MLNCFYSYQIDVYRDRVSMTINKFPALKNVIKSLEEHL